MWKFNGTTFTDDEINKYSEEMNMSASAYVSKFNVEKEEEEEEEKEEDKNKKEDKDKDKDKNKASNINSTLTDNSLDSQQIDNNSTSYEDKVVTENKQKSFKRGSLSNSVFSKKFTTEEINKGIPNFSVINASGQEVQINKPVNRSDLWLSSQEKLKNIKKEHLKQETALLNKRQNKEVDDATYKNEMKLLQKTQKEEKRKLLLTQDISATDNKLLTYEDALDNLIRDPELIKEGNTNVRYKDFFKKARQLADSSYDPYGDDDNVIDLDNEVKAKVIDISSKQQLQQLAKNRMSLEDKESLLVTARTKVIEEKQIEYQEQLEQIGEEISLISGGDMTMDNLDSPKRIEQYNALVEKSKALRSSFQTMQGQYGLDVATGILSNSFEGTKQLKQFNERYAVKGDTAGDLMSRFNSGIMKAGLDMTVGFTGYLMGTLGSEITNLVSDGGDYNIFDEFVDVVDQVASFNAGGTGKKSKFEFTGGPKGYARLAADALPFTLAIIGSVKGGNITGVKKIIGNTIGGKAGRLNGLSSRLKNEILVADAAFRVTTLDNVREAESLGLEGGSATAYAFAKSMSTAITSAKIGIEGQLLSAPKAVSATALKTFAGALKTAATKQGSKNAVKSFLELQGGEMIQEETEVLFDLATKTSFALALPGYENSVQQQKELIASTLMLSSGLGGGKVFSDFKQGQQGVIDAVIRQGSDLKKSFDVMIKSAKDPATIQQLEKGKQYAIDIIRAAKIAPENVTAEQLKLLVEKQELVRKKEGIDSAFHPELNEQIKEIDNKINEGQIVKGKAIVAEKIKKGTDAYIEKLGIVVPKGLDTQAKVDEFISKLPKSTQQEIKKSKGNKDLGFFYETGDFKTETINGKEVKTPIMGFVVNQAVAQSKGNITTEAHELAHFIIHETVKNSPETQKNLGIALTNELAKINFDNITDTEFGNRLGGYLASAADPKKSQTEEGAWEEALTLFSEATLTGDIVYDDSIFNNIKDTFNRIMKSAGIQKEFNTGRDVYNFVKDYNTSILKGKVDKRIVKGAQKGFEGKLVDKSSDVVVDKTVFKKSEAQKVDALVGPKTDGEYTMTKKQWLDGGITKAYNELMKEDGRFAGLLKKGIQGSSIQGQSRTEFESLVKDEITDVLMKFDPSKNNSLSGWVNSLMFKKKGTALKKAKKAKTRSIDDKTPIGSTIASNIMSSDISADENIDNTPKQITSKVRKIFGIKDGDKVYNLIKSVGRDILKGKLPATGDKKLLGAINKQARESGVFDAVSEIVNEMIVDGTFPNKVLDFVKVADVKTLVKMESGSKDGKIFAKGKKLTKVGPIDKAIAEKKLPSNTNRYSQPIVWTKLPTTLKQIKDFIPKRKAAIISAISETVVKDATPEVIKESTTIEKRKQAEESQDRKYNKNKDTAEVLDVLDRDPNLKLSKENIDGSSVTLQKALGIENAIIYNANNQNDIDSYAEILEKTWSQYLPIEILKAAGFASVNATDKEKVRKRGQYFTGKAFDIIKRKYIANERSFTPEQRRWVNAATTNKGFTTTKNDVKSLIDFKSAEYKEYIKDNFDGAEYIFLQLQDMMQNNPETIPSVAAFFNTASSSSNHLIRQIGIPRGVDKNYLKNEKLKAKVSEDYKKGLISEEKKKELFKKYKTEKEHVWQQNQAGEYIFDMMATGNVETPGYFQVVRDNFFMLGLTSYNNNKLKDSKGIYGDPYDLGNGMTQEFTDALNKAIKTGDFSKVLPSLQRYFNSQVNNNGGGFNSNDLTFDGKPISEIYNVAVAAELRNTETQAFQNELIKEQMLGDVIDSQGQMDEFLGVAPSKEKAATENNNMIPAVMKFSKSEEYTNNNVLEKMAEIDNKSVNEELKFSKDADLSKGMNDIIQAKTGIASEKTYSRVKAEVVGANKGRFDFFIPPSAEDFTGLLYKTLGKGKIGDSQMAWYKAHLLNPFARAMDNISRDRVALQNDFKALKKELKGIPKTLKKKVPGENYTQEQAVRAYIWNKQGMTIPGLAGTDIKTLTDFVAKNPDLVTFADQLIAMQKGDQYAAPGEGWIAGNITTDLMEGINTTKRAKYLEVWQTNADQIFSESNLSKLEAAYGKDYRVALDNILQRMKTGKNRSFGGDNLTGRVTDWLTNSIGAIMFFNTRSAVLQTISAINFINFKDNNIFAAGKAFANQPQYWKDFKTLFNSDFLLERRDGLKLNVNEADIADMAKRGGVRGVISELLKLGFLPTQLADSFAIASGGSTFYRNRVKALEKEGMSTKDAEVKAFQDFRETAEESQQSSRPDKISMQQAGPLGRIILAFANTPAQYARIIKKAASDLKNGRGDAKTNISKILYYGVAQNLIFNALQQALFGLAFGDEEEEEVKEEKYVNVANGMADSLLRGMGLGGAVFSVLKNTALKLNQESDKGRPNYQNVLQKEILRISPPISSKVGKLGAAGRAFSWNKKEMMEKGWSIDNPAYLAAGQVIAATTNIPLDRAFKKIENIRNASNSDLEAWQRVASAAGWSAWELGIDNESSESTPKLTSEEKLTKLTKAEQVDSLLSLGVSKKQINNLKLESDRVKALLDPKNIKPEKISKKDSLFGLSKKQQVEALTKLGLTKKQIRGFKVESDRVEALLNPKNIKIEKLSEKDSLFGLNKKQQVAALIKLGFTKKEIRTFKSELDRVTRIMSKKK